MKRREIWGAALTIVAAVLYWWGTEVWEQPGSDAAGRRLVFYFQGITESSVIGWAVVLSIVAGVIGAFLLVASLIGRIRRRWLRISATCLSVAAALPAAAYLALLFVFGFMLTYTGNYTRFEAADGRSVLLVESPVDADDAVDVYTGHDEFRYVYHQEAEGVTGFPRVRDRNCHLEAKEELLLLTCGPDTVMISPG